MDPGTSSRRLGAADYGRTRWSVVRALAAGGEAEARSSLTDLCRRYWVPVYAYLRRCGHPPRGAAELTQSFLSWLLQHLRAEGVDRAHGFRSFLRLQLQRFLANDWTELEQSAPLEELAPPWPLEDIEARQRRAHSPDSTPEQAFQRSFAFELLLQALDALRQEATAAGRAQMFEALRPWLTREPAPGEIAAAAADLGMAPLAALVAVRRLRQRFQELVDEQLLQTLEDSGALADERQALLGMLSGTQG